MPSRRLRVLFLASYFPKPDNPLMGTWALSQAQALARQDIDLLVASFTSWVPKSLAITPGAKAYANCPQSYTWEGEVKVHYPRWLYYPVKPIKQWAYANPTPYLKLAWWSAKRVLCQMVEEFQPDVIFCHHSLPNGWLVAQFPAHLYRPLITLDHDFEEITDCYIHPHRKGAIAVVVNRAWAMLAVASRMQHDIQQLFPQAQVLTHYNGVEPIPKSLFDNRRPLELRKKKIILVCALFAERKGIPLLIEAFHQIALAHPDAVLRIIGSGPDEEKIKDTVNRLALNQRVQLVGKKPHSEVLQEMVWADCFALVGWNEPFATVYLEAMAAGLPIVCCNDGGINDVISDRVHGFAVPPKNVAATAAALDRMLSDDAKRIEMGIQAQRLIHQKLTWDARAKELLGLFEMAVSGQMQYAA
ncbi:glycosyltransferase family 4 protein [Leptothermofonsia sp. ETS-13]|uniref:glycosyltransferase family 4 protein n=1 Tax=Leptothermofonsia sp. ETS-13 TaxID=3035696 RepID=UPI003BA15E86